MATSALPPTSTSEYQKTSALAPTSTSEYQKTSTLPFRAETEYQKIGVNPYEAAVVEREIDALAAHIDAEVLRQLTTRGASPQVHTLPAEGVFLKIRIPEEECKKSDDE